MEKKKWTTPLPDEAVANKTMDEIDNALSVAIMHYCAWNRSHGCCDKSGCGEECEKCPANALLDIVFLGDRDVLGEQDSEQE